MDKNTFIYELTINLKHLTNEIKAEEILILHWHI